MPICTIFENIYVMDSPRFITIKDALERIKTGRSKEKIDEIRKCVGDSKANSLKAGLPSVCFSGTFTKRFDENLKTHTNFICLDFDSVDIDIKGAELASNKFIYALWLSPRGNGLKALVKIADGSKHREHFEALKELFPEVDKSGINVSRVCYESYDPNLVINEHAEVFAKIKVYERVEVRQALTGETEIFQAILKWLANRNDAFVSGERNLFLFKLSAACCRFGLSKSSAENLILSQFPTTNDFTDKEAINTINSAYRANGAKAGSAQFDRDVLVDNITRQEMVVDARIFDKAAKLHDVVYGGDVKEAAINLYKVGYKHIYGINVPELDELFKPKRCDLTLLSGYGNVGKSQFSKWYQVMRAILYGEHYAGYVPEDWPTQNYYHDLTEILLGCDCTPKNHFRPSLEEYNNAYDFISKHFFYIQPTTSLPTAEYIKQKFLELIIKENVDGVLLDPFNQLSSSIQKYSGRSDKYLEFILADFSRFAQVNNIYFTIIAHPVKAILAKDGNYPCPNVFDIAEGAMWNNKCDNILIYHRKLMQTNPTDSGCEFHSKKIRDQKTVGKRGMVEFTFNYHRRRFEFAGIDHMKIAIKEKGLFFKKIQSELNYNGTTKI